MGYTLNEALEEIDSLRAKLADSVSRETLIATEQERDEARGCARRMWKREPMSHWRLKCDIQDYPWLEDSP